MADERESYGGERVFRIDGMHCANCPGLIEDRLKELPQVERVSVSYPSGRTVVAYRGELDVALLDAAIERDGYRLMPADGNAAGGRFGKYLEVAAAFLVLIALALVLQHFQLLPRGLSVSDEMSYGLIFAIGLVASVSSCLAVTGGLLVALAAKYNEANPYLADRQRFAPHFWFNAGRLISYLLLGGVIGALGTALTLSPAASGVLTILASIIMIALGLSMLGLLPPIQHLLPRLPQSLTRRLHDAASRETRTAAFLLGGAITMLAFALGTLPALLSLSAISSLARGAFQRHFLRFAGTGVILLGLLNIQYGFVLTGSGMKSDVSALAAGNVPTGNPQRISMKVVGLEYQPHQFTVQQGVPVYWVIDASEAEGCGRMLLSPRLGIRKLLSDDSSTLITFTPDQPGDYAFNCGMGMMTPDSKITVIPGEQG